jgi:hypothetical protein
VIRLVAKAKRHWVAHHCGLLVALTVGWPSLGLGDQADIVISNAKVISPPHTVIDNGTIVVIKGKITYVGPYRKEANAKRSIDAGGGRTLRDQVHRERCAFPTFHRNDFFNGR